VINRAHTLSHTNFVPPVPRAGADRNDMEGVDDVEQSLLVLDHDIVPANENKLGMRDREFFSIGGANDERALSHQLLPNQLSVHAAFIVRIGASVKCSARPFT